MILVTMKSKEKLLLSKHKNDTKEGKKLGFCYSNMIAKYAPILPLSANSPGTISPNSYPSYIAIISILSPLFL